MSLRVLAEGGLVVVCSPPPHPSTAAAAAAAAAHIVQPRARSRHAAPLCAQLPNEAELLQAAQDKVGSQASQDRLIWHLRASRGKIFWAGEAKRAARVPGVGVPLRMCLTPTPCCSQLLP
jgi:hypothetical protein